MKGKGICHGTYECTYHTTSTTTINGKTDTKNDNKSWCHPFFYTF